jgi:hypothetical protein
MMISWYVVVSKTTYLFSLLYFKSFGNKYLFKVFLYLFIFSSFKNTHTKEMIKGMDTWFEMGTHWSKTQGAHSLLRRLIIILIRNLFLGSTITSSSGLYFYCLCFTVLLFCFASFSFPVSSSPFFLWRHTNA